MNGSRRQLLARWRRWRGAMRQDQHTTRLKTLVSCACAAGIAVGAVAAVRIAQSPPGWRDLAGLAAFLVFISVAERYPVPVEGTSLRGYSLATVFNVAGIVLFGWEPMIFVCILSLAGGSAWTRQPLMKVAYNTAALVLAVTSGGLLLATLPVGASLWKLVASVGLTALAYGLPTLLLVSAAMSLSDGKSYLGTLERILRWSILPFLFGVSASLTAIVLWQRSPFLIAALAGPLAAIDLYERQRHKARSAMRLASTDPLTGLGNPRRFHERLQEALDEAESSDGPIALCYFDLDNLKLVNDEFGHPAGDRVLVAVASRLRHGGEAFRLGGDEFAVILSGRSGDEAFEVASAILARVASLQVDDLPRLTMSCGIAAYPSEGVNRGELTRLADSALYWAKDHGKNRVRIYHPEVLSAHAFERLGANPSLSDRLRAAASLADAVDARDAHAGAHSRRVGDLAAQIGAHLKLDAEQIELLRLAGHLHDVGKLAIPEELLRKEDPLSGAELVVLQRHPEIGFQMIESLGLGPVADWVRYHHERWDGQGYPRGLAEESIPLGARIIFAADSWEAMTSDRTYRRGLSTERALAEIQALAGKQFDPEIARALTEVLGLASERKLASEA
ncbi:MAG: bifunctional diguanylate cyclase/phosphohydrolase [Gaiellaceae bacterium]